MVAFGGGLWRFARGQSAGRAAERMAVRRRGAWLSQFEYITVLTSFVVAVGVSQLLSGWGRLYLTRSTDPPYPLQVTASTLLLVALLQSI